MRIAAAAASIGAGIIILLVGCTAKPEPPRDSASQEPPVIISPTATPSLGAESQPSEPNTFVDFDDFLVEYEQASSDLVGTLPDGVALPSRPPGEWQTDAQFEAGTGEMQAAFEWQCLWLEELAVAQEQSRSKDATVAIEHLSEWVELPQVRPHLDATSVDLWESTFIAPAREGEVQSLLSLRDGC